MLSSGLFCCKPAYNVIRLHTERRNVGKVSAPFTLDFSLNNPRLCLMAASFSQSKAYTRFRVSIADTRVECLNAVSSRAKGFMSSKDSALKRRRRMSAIALKANRWRSRLHLSSPATIRKRRLSLPLANSLFVKRLPGGPRSLHHPLPRRFSSLRSRFRQPFLYIIADTKARSINSPSVLRGALASFFPTPHRNKTHSRLKYLPFSLWWNPPFSEIGYSVSILCIYPKTRNKNLSPPDCVASTIVKWRWWWTRRAKYGCRDG